MDDNLPHTGTRRRYLCAPEHFDVLYSINPWMDPSIPVDKALARRQWDAVVDALASAGDDLVFVDPKPGCPDMVFLGDAGVVLGGRFLCSRFRHPEREPEAGHYAKWFSANGYEVTSVPTDAVFEGLGDLANWGSRAIVGHGPRTNQAGIDALLSFAPHLDVVAEVELPDPRFYHLATAVTFIDADTVMYYPDALTPSGVESIRKAIAHPIPVSDEDIFRYQACNCLTIGRTVVLDGCTLGLERALGAVGFDVLRLEASEFKKGGGSVRCLALTALDFDRRGAAAQGQVAS